MANFYENIIGLWRLEGNHGDGIIFLKIAEGYAGHTTILVLFSETLGVGPENTRKKYT